MMIYTSYYANPALKNISPDSLRAISVSVPKDMGCGKIKEFAPAWTTVAAYKDGKIDWTEYTRQYVAQLDKLGIVAAMKLLENNCVYLCFEGKGKNCHRHLFAEWLRKHGIEIREL